MLFELFKLFFPHTIELSLHSKDEVVLKVAGGAADDEAGLDDAFLGVVAVQGALDEADEYVGGLFAHL